ncbi:MAG: erythromycin esterase family protein [Ginsengibacter sp.]
MKQTVKTIFYLLSALLSANLSFAQDTTEVVTAWLKQNSIPIKYIEAGNSSSDLQPLKKILKDVQVIGLGEATHGTHEFSKFKHRLVEFLVTQMGFNAFAIEASFSDCEPINDYILTGKGDRATVLTNQNYTAWDTEEFSVMLDWMRAYNQKVPDEKKLRFYGLDILSLQKVGREKARLYFQKYLPEKLASIDSVITIFEGQEANWLSHMNQTALRQSFIPLNDLINYLTDHKDRFVGASSLKEWEQTHKYLEVMQQSLYFNLKNVPPSFASKKLERDEFMWQNLLYLIERERPNAKFMIWAYDGHLSSNAERKPKGVAYYLKQKLSDKYYGLGLECYEGTFQARELLPDSSWGDLKIDTLPVIPKSINWHFAQTGEPYEFVDLRQASSDPIVNKWLDTPSSFAAGYWIHRNANENFETHKLKGVYDGVLFVQRSTPVHPTKNALARSKGRIGF